MKIVLGIALLLLSFSAGAVSMGQIVGRLMVWETNQPAAFAEIVFENSMDKITVTTNEHGYYYADHMPTGRYEMRTVYNNHTFVVKKIRVYDSYASEINFRVSNSNNLPEVVEIQGIEPIISAVNPTDAKVSDNGGGYKGSKPLGEVLSMVYLKGGRIKFFVDGSPVMGGANLQGW